MNTGGLYVVTTSVAYKIAGGIWLMTTTHDHRLVISELVTRRKQNTSQTTSKTSTAIPANRAGVNAGTLSTRMSISVVHTQTETSTRTHRQTPQADTIYRDRLPVRFPVSLDRKPDKHEITHVPDAFKWQPQGLLPHRVEPVVLDRARPHRRHRPVRVHVGRRRTGR